MQRMNLETLCQGGFSEQFNRALAQVAANILDPNTEPEKARELDCIFKFKPNDDRTLVTLEIQTKTKLLPAAGIKTTMLMGKDISTGTVAVKEFENEPPKAFDPETGEIIEPVKPGSVMDLRRAVTL